MLDRISAKRAGEIAARLEAIEDARKRLAEVIGSGGYRLTVARLEDANGAGFNIDVSGVDEATLKALAAGLDQSYAAQQDALQSELAAL